MNFGQIFLKAFIKEKFLFILFLASLDLNNLFFVGMELDTENYFMA